MESVDRVTFWRNWFDGARQMPDELRLAWYDAVFEYAFEGVEPPPSDGKDIISAIKFAAVAGVRATIAISRKRKTFGAKGGSTREAKAKQARSKSEANAKQKRSKREAKPNQDKEQVQEQVQEQEQEQEHNANSITATARARKQPTRSQFVSGAPLCGVPADFAASLYDDLQAAGWTDAEGRAVKNWRRYLKAAYIDSQKKICAARASTWNPERGGSIDDVPDAR